MMKRYAFLLLLLPIVLAQVPEEEPVGRNGLIGSARQTAPDRESPVSVKPIIAEGHKSGRDKGDDDDDDDDGGGGGGGNGGKRGDDDDDDDGDDGGERKRLASRRQLSGREGSVYGGSTHRNNRLGDSQLSKQQWQALRNHHAQA
jgi:hypothetical protein